MDIKWGQWNSFLNWVRYYAEFGHTATSSTNTRQAEHCDLHQTEHSFSSFHPWFTAAHLCFGGLNNHSING